MAKAKFPGRPSKCSNRKRVLSSELINCKEYDGFRAAEDAYCRLSVFDFLFPDENEGSLFHGFSPHDIQDAKVQYDGYVKGRSAKASGSTSKGCAVMCQSASESRTLGVKKSQIRPPKCVSSTAKETIKRPTVPQPTNIDGTKKIGVCSNPAVSGKFVLPSRSAHSSRVIKPNKRFLENQSPDRTNKKARGDDDLKESVSDTAVEKDDVFGGSSDSVAPSVSPSKDKTPHSPVKFVLQKPKLKIDSEPFSPVEGPFSSQSSPPLEKLKGSKRPPTKVICGVCGSMWYFKQVRLARKYGIFSCDPCRKFIMKTLKAHEAKSMGTLQCSTNTGNCVIRQFTLGSCIPFSAEKPPETNDSSSRCQACWLNLCLRSYHLPSEVLKRLSKYLPPEIKDRPIIESESKKSGLRSSADHSQKTLKEKGEPKEEREVLPAKTSKGKIKLPLAGPRVKHVCRSASLVLGQPVAATFDDKGSVLSDNSEAFREGNRSDEIGDEIFLETHDGIETPQAMVPVSYESGISVYERPKARMLQDLGRDNCDLLDGMEKHELERKLAKVSIDFWESYDPEEVTLAGFPLIGYNNMNLRALCFLCGSAGLEKLVHCSNCCEAYHTFCVSTLKNDSNKKEWWRLDWFCPKCTECRSCLKPGGTQLLCASCHASYHSNCVTSGRANVMDGTWMCPSCLHCKSCKDPMVHVFVGNVPLCKQCFKLRKKGNFCPLCQVCYDENDYDTKMMECAECKRWIHAKCEKISDETYQILSYLPSSIEFICRHCCNEPPPLWKQAVSAQLKVGLLNVIKALSKNKVVCNLLKASPMKKSCSCRNYLQKPILLKNLSNALDTPAKVENEQLDDKCSDLGLLTPKLTKDDEECLESAKINLVNNKVIREDNPAVYDFTEDVDDLPITRFEQTHSLNLLSIVGWSSDRGVKVSKPSKSPSSVDVESLEKKCSCESHDWVPLQSPLSIMEIKKKIQGNHYSSLKDFNSDMVNALEGIHLDSTKVYQNSLKQVFPWFDPNNPGELSFNEEILDDATNLSDSKTDIVITNKVNEDKKDSTSEKGECEWKDLLVHEPDYYYVDSSVPDLRTCMFCKALGEGDPSKEGRLLYCGHNEWVHLNCALWSSEVFEEIDGSLQNVHSAISRARMIRCFSCSKKGASVGCCARSCPSAYHLPCALDSNCVFLANKEVYCRNHIHLRGTRDLHDPKDFYVSRAIHVELDPKKRKEVLHSDVRLAIGSLLIHLIGEVLPEYSDSFDIIIPCNFKSSRLFWSAEEPWKLVRYFIETRVETPISDYLADNGINFTIDHTLEFTPPPSPVDLGNRANFKCLSDEKDIRNLLTQVVDTVCAREEDSNLADQQNADLLPPDVKEAIFEDLPHEILDGILMHDIFTKINFDDFTECRMDKMDMDVVEMPACLPKKNFKEDKAIKPSSFQKSTRRYVGVDSDYREPDCKWKSSNILQLDGTVDDSSDSESVDSDVCTTNCVMIRDEPVKCDRCHRTYRTSIGYERHLPSCDSDFSSESNSSDDDEIVTAMKQEQVTEVQASVQIIEHTIDEVVDEISDSSSEVSSCDTQTHSVEMIVDVYQDLGDQTNDHAVTIEEVQEVQSLAQPAQPAIIVQQIPHETMMPQYVSTSYPQQPAIQQPTDLQYFNSGSSGGYYQTQLGPAVLPSVQPTVVGTIVQSGGVDQIVINQPTNSLDVYSQPTNGIYITNTPMLVGMETVVSNTVMSSSQFLPGVPGMMASSYSATTTQVFHAAKPQIEIPQNYVVVNTQPVQSVINHAPPNLPALMSNSVQPSNPWNNYQVNIPDSYKMGNVSSSYQTVTTKIIHEHKNVDGVKMYNSTQETIVIEPMARNNALQQHYSCVGPIRDNVVDIKEPVFEKPLPNPKPSQPKVVELPRMPSVNREKPQQAVAPVVIKRVTPLVEKVLPQKKEIPPKVCEKKKCPVISDRMPIIVPLKQCEVVEDKVMCSKEEPSLPEPNLESNVCPESAEPTNTVSEETATEVDSPAPGDGVTKETEDQKPFVQPKESHRHPKITYQIRSEDGFTYATSDLQSAWEKVFNRVQVARKAKGLPPLSKNPFADPGSVLKKALGLGNNGVKYILEQLPGVSSCTNYKPVYHKKKQSALEFELSRKPKENYSGCARTEEHEHVKRTYDMFSWLASRHRRPPKLANCENDILNGNGRRTMSLPMAMRFRHLKETSKITIGVFRSDIHGRGLFALRDIDSGEMVIEYAGEVIRSSLTDKREKYYTAKGIGCYMFRIDDQSVVDATMKGNAARFINHSCEPNCYSKVVDILGKKHILIFALRKIIQGEELTYDYKFPLEEEKINCHCLSKKCRKYLN